jgi:Rrf2 family protein
MISKTGIHALRAIVALSELPEGVFAGAADIAGRTGAPPNYLGKLLKNLAGEGLLESQKGKGGGFRLARDPARISIYEVLEPIDKISRWSGCFMGKSRCSEKSPCAVHGKWGGVRDAYLQFLKETKLAELADPTIVGTGLR